MQKIKLNITNPNHVERVFLEDADPKKDFVSSKIERNRDSDSASRAGQRRLRLENRPSAS